MRSFPGLVLLLSVGLGSVTLPAFASPTTGTQAVQRYLLTKLERMTQAAHDFARQAQSYSQIIDEAGGNYDEAAIHSGPQLAKLIAGMQNEFRIYHNDGYETIEGVVAGMQRTVDFDTYLDAGVPKSQATTDNPSSPLVLRGQNGRIIIDRGGNLFHYVIEPTLWGTRENYLHRLKGDTTTKAGSMRALPLADVLVAASNDCVRKLDELQDVARRWNPTIDECIGALVWMTPTLNGYFDDWRDSRYNPANSLGRYVAESRVLDMRGIMSSLQLTCNAILPELDSKDPALAAALRSEYSGILSFISRVDQRDRQSGGKISAGQIEELANQAKTMTDQLTPHLKQMAVLLKVKLPPKPTLA